MMDDQANTFDEADEPGTAEQASDTAEQASVEQPSDAEQASDTAEQASDTAEQASVEQPSDAEQASVEQPSDAEQASDTAEQPSEAEPASSDAPAVVEQPDESSAAEQTDDAVKDNTANDTANDDTAKDEPGTTFADLELRSELRDALTGLGYEEPTPIQRETIPLLLAGHDLLGQAATGTGKTAAFALPILNELETGNAALPSALILVPTRELAVQVSEAFSRYGAKQNVKVVPIYGGQPIGRQLHALNRGVHVVVATPGRALDHIKRGSLTLDAINTVVLDEADEMLDMGFSDDLEAILQETPPTRQTVLFSATMPPRINSIAKRYQRDPKRVQIGRGNTTPGTALISQRVYYVQRNHKTMALGRILDIEAPRAALVFCRTRTEVDELTETMNARSYRAEALHGGMNQQQRDRVMARLRDGSAELLLATDVAARGLDVDTLTHVINFEVPSAPESYVHRIGRVGRAGREGTAITLAEPRQRRLLQNIERLTKQTIEVQTVPTVADLRDRQIEMTVTAVREALTSDDLEDFNAVLHALTGEDSDRNIALAAIKLAHVGRGAVIDEIEIPDASTSKGYDRKRSNDDRGGRGKPNRSGSSSGQGGDGHRGQGNGPQGNRPQGDADTGFIYVGLGRKAGIRPGDLVGAIANEAGLSGKQIGPIRISDHFSVVGVPVGSVDKVIADIGSTSLRGKRMKVRRYVD
jgi:ATP-dependent RNA helicase DeaD